MKKRDLNNTVSSPQSPQESPGPVAATIASSSRNGAAASILPGKSPAPATEPAGEKEASPEKITSAQGRHDTPMKAMILAAGLGTRLKPFTDLHPKALAMVNGKTILERNIEYLAGSGIRKVIINVHHFADQVTGFIAENKGFGSEITFSDETSEVLETGGGLKKAAWYFLADALPFVVINVDILTDLKLDEMISQHIRNRPLATLAVTTRYTSRYFLFDEFDRLCGWKNIKTGEQKISREAGKYVLKAFSGIHVISPEIFSMLRINGKFSMVDAYLELAKSQAIEAFDHSSNSKFIDVGKPESILKAEALFR